MFGLEKEKVIEWLFYYIKDDIAPLKKKIGFA